MNAHLEVGTRATLEEASPNFVRWLDELHGAVQIHTGQRVFPYALTPNSNLEVVAKKMSACSVEEQEQGRVQLFAEACHVFVPLMQANMEAYVRIQKKQVVPGRVNKQNFNEAAFDSRKSLYRAGLPRLNVDGGHDGGHGVRLQYVSVVKTFQVAVWQRVLIAWDALPQASKKEVEGWSGIGVGELLLSTPPGVELL
jgi:hypothetical protein